ncbi:peroxiredoxin family/glutaredoxin [Gregarina niphandrodes]|uniref:Peroxiredoxin family/glutaredoxin n=1 Tax=Gregarina niphandrodes TaxID=110365 RepID=A0A023BC97_GRENI|nr:peroxiredoxin family/glutaredoxin [Gregarina niphandrodes]EZG82119.1 peroxiredoxin family/glutaredoxin [Gregarina niphandrodes]|eukprot:XP_011129037.1 peroxiredoxin family/glutaredoxin [Gregarina niphandrodes]
MPLESAKFVRFEGGKPTSVCVGQLWKGKKVVVFALPGAFTPTCTTSHLPRYEELYETFREQGVDEVYCVSMNDDFVMKAWFEKLGVNNIKSIPDGNGEVSKALGIWMSREELGFGPRARRSSFLINDLKIEKSFIESETPGDPFEVSGAENMLHFINPDAQIPKPITVFGTHACSYCIKTKKLLEEKRLKYVFVELSPSEKSIVIGALNQGASTTPQIFIDGKCIGGYTELAALLQ